MTKKSVIGAAAAAIAATAAAATGLGKAAEETGASVNELARATGAKTTPTTFQIAKMEPEKKRYWQNKLRAQSEPAYYRALRNIQREAGRMGHTFPDTRQGERHALRRRFKMPLGMSSSDWQRQLKRA